LSAGPLTLDPSTTRVTLAGAPVRLSGHEFRVLSYLMHHQPRVVTRTELSEHIYEHDLDRDSNTVEVFIARLRRKLGASAIETVRGIGYRMSAPPGSR
jgi:two-component system OmpR family response regulator